VRAVVSDRRGYEAITSGEISNQPELLTWSDFYPFGMQMPGRNGSAGDYRYGFQGQEKDDEIKGEGNSINYKYRMHDPRIGRFFAVDPIAGKYPHNSPYALSENRVIDGVELEGLEYARPDDLGINPEAADNGDGTYSFELDGMMFNNMKTVSYNGETFIKFGFHLYYGYEGWSTAGSEDEKITSWVYNPVDDALSSSDWVAYDYNASNNRFGQCAYAAGTSCDNAGYSPLGGWYYNQIYMYSNEPIFSSSKRPDARSKAVALDVLHLSLEFGMPVMVGITYPSGNNDGGDGMTDHYVVIYNRGSDQNGEYFLFSENVAGGVTEGMGAYRKFYIQSDGTLRTISSDASYNGEVYTITGVRLNQTVKDYFGGLINGVNRIK